MAQIRFDPSAAKTSQFSTDPSYAERAGQENLDQASRQSEQAQQQSNLSSSLSNLALGYELGGGEIVKPITDLISSGTTSAIDTLAGSSSTIGSTVPSFGIQTASPTYTLGVPNIGSAAPMESTVTAPSMATEGIGTSIGNAAAPVAIVYGGLKGYQGIQKGSRKDTGVGLGIAGAGAGWMIGAQIGSIGGPVGAIIGAAAGAIIGVAAGHIKTGKSQAQQKRDAVRSAFQQGGLVDKDYNVHLADGSVYNIGVDGGPKPEYGNMRPYELDVKDPLVGAAIPAVAPLVYILTGGDPKSASDFTGYLVRAAMSNAGGDPKKIDANIRAFYAQIHADAGTMKQALDQLKASGKLTDQQYNVYLANMSRVAPPAPNGGGFQMPQINMPSFNMPQVKAPPSPPPGVADNSGALSAAYQNYQNTYGQNGGLQAAFNNLSNSYRRQ